MNLSMNLNEPFYEDANYVAKHLFEGNMQGNVIGDQIQILIYLI
jgi:hypothetical protein